MALTRTPWVGRRTVLVGVAALALTPSRQRAQAQARLTATPRQTSGPFYPTDWSGDIDNDLVIVRGEAAKAIGIVTHISGAVFDAAGQPIAGAMIEIWQCDARGIYRHPQDEQGTRRHDAGFQGRGRTVTDNKGHYAFRTIRPVAYPGRTPHIHFSVNAPGAPRLVTQMYVYGERGNARDSLLNNIRDRRQREALIVRLDPAEALEPSALAGKFDIVLS